MDVWRETEKQTVKKHYANDVGTRFQRVRADSVMRFRRQKHVTDHTHVYRDRPITGVVNNNRTRRRLHLYGAFETQCRRLGSVETASLFGVIGLFA